MTTPTIPEQISAAYDALDMEVHAEYPPDLYEGRRAEFEARLHRANLETRGLAIEEALRDEFIRPETANELLDELFEIDKELEKIGE